MARHPKRYVTAEIEAALAVIAVTRKPDGSPNWTRAAQQSRVCVNTLKKWVANPDLNPNDETVTMYKTQLAASFLDSVRKVREAASARMLELIPNETDLHKVAGALKIANDAARLESGEATNRSEVTTVERKPIEDGALRELRTRLNASYN